METLEARGTVSQRKMVARYSPDRGRRNRVTSLRLLQERKSDVSSYPMIVSVLQSKHTW